jgi:hypothetical protein
MNAKQFALVLVVAVFLVACGAPATPSAVSSEPTTAPPAPSVTLEPVDPAAIAQSFNKAVNDGDIEAAMALVAEDIKCRGAVYLTGKQSYRSVIQADINSGARTEISDLKIEGDKVTYNWEGYSEAGFFLARGTETLQIKDGLIICCEVVVQ